ncbi:uncharacterized protein LOC125959680 [Anopheles darlingi]|uniref:uncharacterized protein LOC125959680 n=1 Tax=Anopheles darlingi TaxID=43151 RepID=UPI002100486A|nr:uncharacterized protein LOC125959680 [Anopheles darlingi]XP_049548481.1 uncharacterized protein LOC125959680 [Anopheles darlingi]
MQNARTMCMVILLLIVGFVGAENLLFSDCGVRTSRRQPRSYFPIGLGGTRRMDNESVSSTSTQTEAFVRNPKIMHGTPTVEGQYPWQVSLELLHPSYGFIGHWCGGVLIDRNWVLSAAHCIHNDLFNLPLPALWTVVLGEYDRRTESGYEQRIPVDKIILHEKYHNFKHDLVLLKLTRPANTSPSSRVRKICLPFADFKVNSMPFDPRPEQQERPKPNGKPAYFFDHDAAIDEEHASADDDQEGFPDAVPFRDDNFLRRLKQSFERDAFTGRSNGSRTARFMINQLVVGKLRTTDSHRPPIGSNRRNFQFPPAARIDSRHIITKPSVPIERRSRRLQLRSKNFRPLAETAKKDTNSVNHYQHRRVNLNSKFGNNRRRNDKFSHAPVYYRNEPNYRNEDLHDYSMKDDATAAPAREVETEAESISAAMPDTSQYVDCLATGWGKSTIDDELTDVLLQTRAPIQSSKKCEEAYGDFIKLHRGHLCAGNLDGAGGTCVGDSGGPLQCRISKRGPWILVGITSFGSGCAFKNYPDVYTKISFYRQWIADTIEKN